MWLLFRLDAYGECRDSERTKFSNLSAWLSVNDLVTMKAVSLLTGALAQGSIRRSIYEVTDSMYRFWYSFIPGARAAIEFLRSTFYNSLSKDIRKTPEIYYAGNSISGTYLKQLIENIGDRDFSVNVISKSGTTTEPAIAFRIFKEMLEEKYGKDEAAKRIYATTDRAKGALKVLSTEEGYETFVVPDDVGGRFSVLTAVGLLPIAVAGINIDKLMKGARLAHRFQNMPLGSWGQKSEFRVNIYCPVSKMDFTNWLRTT